MILNALATKRKRMSKNEFKARLFQAWLIVKADTIVIAVEEKQDWPRTHFAGSRQ